MLPMTHWKDFVGISGHCEILNRLCSCLGSILRTAAVMVFLSTTAVDLSRCIRRLDLRLMVECTSFLFIWLFFSHDRESIIIAVDWYYQLKRQWKVFFRVDWWWKLLHLVSIPHLFQWNIFAIWFRLFGSLSWKFSAVCWDLGKHSELWLACLGHCAGLHTS